MTEEVVIHIGLLLIGWLWGFWQARATTARKEPLPPVQYVHVTPPPRPQPQPQQLRSPHYVRDNKGQLWRVEYRSVAIPVNDEFYPQQVMIGMSGRTYWLCNICGRANYDTELPELLYCEHCGSIKGE